jgi:hypothetical protein
MSSTIITPANFAPNLAMYMDAAAIGRVAAGIEDGRIVFNGHGSEWAELDRIVEFNPGADRISVAAAVERGNSSGIKSNISRILGEANYIQDIADATVRRKDRKGNFRREAETSFEWAQKFTGLPEEELGTRDAVEAFLESAFLYTSFSRLEDRTRSYDLFMLAAKAFTKMKRHTAAAIVYELAWQILKPYREEALTVLKLRRKSGEAWLASIEEYLEPDSVRYRVFRGLVHSSFMPSRKTVQELLLALSNQDFEDDNFYDGYANHIRRAYTITNHDEVERHEWRTVKELLEGAALTWNQLEGMEVDISESLMQLARAAEDFAVGKDQYIARSKNR